MQTNVSTTHLPVLVPHRILDHQLPSSEESLLFTLDDAIPNSHLVPNVAGAVVGSDQVHKELVHVPVELGGQIMLKVKRQSTLIHVQICVDREVMDLIQLYFANRMSLKRWHVRRQ